MEKIIPALISFFLLSGCISARWQGGTTNGVFVTPPQGKYFIEDIEFTANMGINTQIQQWPWYEYSQNPETFKKGVMDALPDIFSSDPSAERISLSCRVLENTHDYSVFPFLISLGTIFPMQEIRQSTCKVYVVKQGQRANSGAELRSRQETWIGEPWTLICHFAYPEQDESYTETVTWAYHNYSQKQEQIKTSKYQAFAKAVLRAIELNQKP